MLEGSCWHCEPSDVDTENHAVTSYKTMRALNPQAILPAHFSCFNCTQNPLHPQKSITGSPKGGENRKSVVLSSQGRAGLARRASHTPGK